MAWRVAATIATLATSGCFGVPERVSPISTLRYAAPGNEQATPVLLMPGRRSRAADFEQNGFIDAVREQGLALDIVAVDAHLGYYLDNEYRRLPQRMHDDFVQILIKALSRRVWLVGTSLGALGSLAYAKAYPEDVAGVVLLGAYLGEEPILESIERSGGLRAWAPEGSAGYDYEIRTWKWLKHFATSKQAQPFRLLVGYGANDQYARASRILAKVLPADQVLVDERGGHDWHTWLALWKQLLREEQFAARRGAG